MTLLDKAVEEKWVKKHTIPCIVKHLSAQTIDKIIMSTISDCAEKKLKDQELIEELATNIEKNIGKKDIKKMIDCVCERLITQFAENEYNIHPGFVVNVAYMSFGKSILVIGKDTGFIK